MSKAKALEAVQVFAPGEVNRLANLKKAQIAAEAERLAVGSGWLPVMFRSPEPPIDGEAAQDAQADNDAAGAELEDAEEAQAVV